MWLRAGSAIACLAALSSGGCGHVHWTAQPPTPSEIAEINDAAGDQPASMTLHYVDSQHPCGAEACTVDGARSVSDTPPSGIQRIVSIDGQRLTVVADSGKAWHLDATQIAGVTTQHRLTAAGALLGGAVGFGISGLLAVLGASGPPPDAPASSSGPSWSGETAVAITVIGTLLGAAIGAAIGHNNLTADYFDFGGSGRSFGPRPTFSR